jgi:hypothetical protein
MHYKKFIQQWKHKLKDAQLFVARQLAQSGKQDKTFTWYSKKIESSTCTIKNVSNSENINIEMPSFLWQGNLPNRTSKIKRLLDIQKKLNQVHAI